MLATHTNGFTASNHPECFEVEETISWIILEFILTPAHMKKEGVYSIPLSKIK